MPDPYDLKVTVDVVEFVRPNGQKVFHKVTLPGNLYAKVQRIAIVMGTTGGYQYTLEHLENGTAAVSLENKLYGDFNIVLADSRFWEVGVKELVENFNEEEYQCWVGGFE